MRVSMPLFLVAAISLGLTPLACSEEFSDEPLEPVPASAKPAMTGLVAAATTLIPLSLEDGAFADPTNKTRIDGALAGMSSHVELLQRYAWGEDEGARWLARSLGQDVAAAQDAYAARQFEEARFRVQKLTANCVACHSRLPSADDSDLGTALFASVDTSTLHPDELAQLQLATRQFKAAAATYEKLLSAPPRGGDVGRLWYFVDYLVLSIRVLDDRARPLPLLKKQVAAKGLPTFMQRDLEGWLVSLEALQGPLVPPDAAPAALLDKARSLVSESRALDEAPSGQQGLVRWIVASSLLHRYVNLQHEAGPALAEAWYLLGLAEARIGHSSWLSQPEYYLETAVRTAPASRIAKDALAHLEWHVAVQYTGSGGEQIPEDVQAHLDELAQLIAKAATP